MYKTKKNKKITWIEFYNQIFVVIIIIIVKMKNINHINRTRFNQGLFTNNT